MRRMFSEGLVKGRKGWKRSGGAVVVEKVRRWR